MSSIRFLRKAFIFFLAILLTAAMFAGCGKTKTITLPGGVKLEMMKVEAGTFTMSAKDGENFSDEAPHQVTLTRDYYIGQTEVTQAQWKAVMIDNPSYNQLSRSNSFRRSGRR